MVGYGKDDQVLAGYSVGITCSVGSTYNYAGKLYNNALRELRSGNLAESTRLQRVMCHFLRKLFSNGHPESANKVLNSEKTFDFDIFSIFRE